ncbi:hypothetical protein CBI38_15685 [Rhodococcus oxybenzonivorans]|uniref:TPM domain-containing protein n=1 Tax=Rhodococcus oxybenzonivorans TaxID=1990687 RepID=A0A2S2BW11_9NOCA|nr:MULTISPECIES: DUF6676 family protein [Rhodococcus]AWK72783.1 hypothetical protein CBI38_15685 [Rhodococcus oxybenzonivorans]
MSAPVATVLPSSAAFPAPTALPLSTDLPEDLDVAAVVTDVSDDGVSAPADEVSDLVAVVDRAADHGIELSIVVLDEDPERVSQLRDLATEVGQEEGGTVLVLSPSWVGTYSDSISRVLLESGQDRTYTSDSVVAADQFVDEIVAPGPPWALMTALIVAVVAVAAAATFYAKSRRRASPDAAPGDGSGAAASTSAPVEHPKP